MTARFRKLIISAAVFGCVVAVVSVAWFRGEDLLYYWDQSLPLNPARFLQQFSHVWRPTAVFGAQDASGLNMLILAAYYWLAEQTIGLSAGQIMLLSAELFVAATGFYQLARRRYLSATDSVWPAVLGAVAYVANPFAILYIWRLNLNQVALFALLPWLLWLIDEYVFQSRRRLVFWVIQALLLLAAVSFSHPAYLISFWSITAVYCLAKTASRWRRDSGRLRPLGRMAAIFAVWAVMNSWWLVPQLRGAGELTSASGNDTSSYISILSTTTSHSSLKRVAVLLGEWHYYDQRFGVADYPSYTLYVGRAFAAASLIWLFVLIIGLVKRPGRQKWFWAAVILILILFITGTSSPLWSLFQRLSDRFVFIRAFRNPYEKAGAIYALAYCIGLVWGLRYLLSARRWWSRAAVLWFVLTLVPGVYLLGSGEVVPSATDRLPGARVTVAEDYRLTADYLLEHETSGRILSLPVQDGPLQYRRTGQTGDYIGQDMLTALTQLPIYGVQTGSETVDRIIKQLEKEAKQGSVERLSRFGFDRLIIHRDQVNSLHYGPVYDVEAVVGRLASNPQLTIEYQNDSLIVLRSSQEAVLASATDQSTALSVGWPTEAVNSVFSLPVENAVVSPADANDADPLPIAPLQWQEFSPGQALIHNNSASYFSTYELDGRGYLWRVAGAYAGSERYWNQQVQIDQAPVISGRSDLELRLPLERVATLFDQDADANPTTSIINRQVNGETTSSWQAGRIDKSSWRREWNQQAQGMTIGSYIEVPNDPSSWYVMELNAQICAGLPASVGVLEANHPFQPETMAQNSLTAIALLGPDSTTVSSAWRRYRLYYQPKTNADHLYLYLLTEGREEVSCTSVSGWRVYTLPAISFGVIGADMPDSSKTVPLAVQPGSNSSFKSSYDSSGEPVIISLNYRFNRRWQLAVDGQAVAADSQLAVDGSSNGWLVTLAPGRHEVEFSFLPDRELSSIFRLLWVLLAGTVLVSVGRIIRHGLAAR